MTGNDVSRDQNRDPQRASLELVRRYLADRRPDPAEGNDVLAFAYDELSRITLAGKHVRSSLVHASAGTVTSETAEATGATEATEAAVAFGAAVDLLHGGFLLHDDLVDQDDLRRGEWSFHASLREATSSAHMGHSLALLAGDIALAGAMDLVTSPQVPQHMAIPATRIVVEAITESIEGELRDITHRIPQVRTSVAAVRTANAWKTTAYTFRAPLMLGAVAAGRDPHQMVPAAELLGFAYQATDDIAGFQGDAAMGRVTMVTEMLADDPAGGVDGAVHRLAAQVRDAVRDAREALDREGLPADVVAGVGEVADLLVQRVDSAVEALGAADVSEGWESECRDDE
ncbi:polyprenyl synthetase family protein [Corynebacterium falsenii]|uniref:polyprenyl synthetase family protein n=1 Tax=Corynebacterium falsenii TaxID=108486 RepID=UPI001CCA0F90|nr:polyprenyl synthetase family protein [Corynebacterium falsenii]MDC7103196.1 polyprenyl synthetase family protein [Corynebacterium falsenii]UBI07325.1 polyprenyl synthetase family protein [Corynebacterium falsenii]